MSCFYQGLFRLGWCHGLMPLTFTQYLFSTFFLRTSQWLCSTRTVAQAPSGGRLGDLPPSWGVGPATCPVPMSFDIAVTRALAVCPSDTVALWFWVEVFSWNSTFRETVNWLTPHLTCVLMGLAFGGPFHILDIWGGPWFARPVKLWLLIVQHSSRLIQGLNFSLPSDLRHWVERLGWVG